VAYFFSPIPEMPGAKTLAVPLAAEKLTESKIPPNEALHIIRTRKGSSKRDFSTLDALKKTPHPKH